MLHVPTISHNLIYIRKLTKDHNCALIIFYSHCAFQDLAMGKTIAVAMKQEGLYYLSDKRTNQKMLSSAPQSQSDSHASQIWLQNKRFGHPPFSLMKYLYPSLFIKQSIESFKCDNCQYSKHHCANFLESYKSVEAFDLIHSDVWGPAPTSNISGATWFVSFIGDFSNLDLFDEE